ncbi:MAG: protein kinase [Chloroflexota bacterium]
MEPGYRIEHYVIVEKIGQGGQAAVWSAHDERLKRTVAIKTISLSQFNTGEGSTLGSGTAPAGASMLTNPDRFREEAEIIAALEHPNILPVYAFGQDSDSLYIVMRYMAAGSLKDLLKSEPLTPARVVTIMEPVASALDLAHQYQIIHRDIKSANILLDAQLHPYLADFGLSMTKGTQTEGGVGTLVYMSPEQMMGDPIDQRSDLYSFGMLMYELLVGELPSADGQPWNMLQVMRNMPLPIPDGMPDSIASVLRRSTALAPDDRFQTAVESVEALREAVTENAQPAAAVEVPVEITDPTVLALMEAQDLFRRAQERWSDGAGRFRFEAGDFKYVDSYYADADDWNIQLTDVGMRLMLRAALEHGHDLEYWWEQIKDTDDRRAVALQALTSDLAPARLRAIEHLAYIQDSTPPAIPIRVANVIDAEPDATVRLAGIHLLERRATPSSAWRSVIYSELIDGKLATRAAHDSDPAVAEAAARMVARLHSSYALAQLGKQAAAGDNGAFSALINVRDEIPALPTSIASDVRRRVFLTLSWRQLLADPLSLVWRYLSATLACGALIGGYAYLAFNDQNGLLFSQRVGNALAAGALYGLLIGFGVFVATEVAARLRAWSAPGRIALAWIIGTLLTAAAFSVYDRYFNGYIPLSQGLLMDCFVFVAGFAIVSGLTHRPSLRSLGGAIGVLLAVYLSKQLPSSPEPLLYLWDGADTQNLTFSLIIGIIVGVLTFLPEWVSAIRRLAQPTPPSQSAT